MVAPMDAGRGTLVVGVDVGGTNTDSVLLDLSAPSASAVKASHKSPTTANVTLSVQDTLRHLLEEAAVQPADISALAIGTTHFLNAIIERDASRIEKVAVLRLASHNFSTGTPPFADWPSALKRVVKGHSAIIPGGCNIDGSLIGPIDEAAVREQARLISDLGLKKVVVVGIGSPMDEDHRQEERVRDLLMSEMGGEDDDEVQVVCSRAIAGSGLLARENAAILNASILSFARRTIRAFIGAMRRAGLRRCPLYLTSNAGHLLPFSEAMASPIRIFSSGATNSIRGAAFLARDFAGGDVLGRTGSVVVDIGGTTTDVGYLLGNGYPRLAKSYSDLAGVKVNLEMASVESVGLGGGSILHTSGADADVRVGPESVGHDLVTEALCFGGATPTATDVAVALGTALGVGTVPVDPQQLAPSIVAAAQARMKRLLEATIDRAKTSPDPCTVILVGGGSILCPPSLDGVGRIVLPAHAGVANAIGAAIARVHGAAETIVHGGDIAGGLAAVRARAVQDAVRKGGDGGSVTVLNEEVAGVPYVEGQTLVRIEVACPADHRRVYAEMLATSDVECEKALDEEEQGEGDRGFDETKSHDVSALSHTQEDDDDEIDFDKYRPDVNAEGEWSLSATDVGFLSVGCYILGCGGGGSPYAPHLELKQLLLEGETIKIVRCEDLGDDDVLPPVASVGTPAVSIERPGGDGVYHAMQAMERLMGARFSKLLAIEIGGANGVGTLVWGSSRYYGIPTVDGDMMGRAYPNFEMVSNYVMGDSIDELLPVTLCSGAGDGGDAAVIPRGQPDAATASAAIRSNLASMGSAAGAAGRPVTGRRMRSVGIPNTYSLAWRLGRAVRRAGSRGRQQPAPGPSPSPSPSSSFSAVARAIVAECGGACSARLLFGGKISAVESRVTTTAHSIGKVVVERLGEGDGEDFGGGGGGGDDDERDTAAAGPGDLADVVEVEVPFMNENLSVVGRRADGSEKVLATVPDLIFLLDVATGENVGVQEYRYGLKVAVMIMAPHPVWATERGLEIAGPRAFGLPYDYVPTMEYTRPRSVIDEFRPVATQ